MSEVTTHTDSSTPVPADLYGQLTLLEELVEAITATDPAHTSGPAAIEAQARVHAATERLSAQRLGWLSEIEADGLWALDGQRTFTTWLAASVNCSTTAAKRQAILARKLRDTLTATARAARAGTVSTEHASVLAGIAATSDARRAALTSPVPGTDSLETSEETGGRRDDGAGATAPCTGEQLLLRLAQQHTMRDFTTLTRRFAHVTDPESDERGFARAEQREFLDLAKTIDGYHLAGFLTDHHGRLLQTALDAFLNPAGAPTSTDPEPAQDTVPAPPSTSRAHRRAGALAALANTVLTNDLTPPGSPARPHLAVNVTWTEFVRLMRATAAQDSTDQDPTSTPLADLEARLQAPASSWEDGTGPIPDAVLQQIAADCTLTRIVFGPDSQILNLGRSARTLTGARRRAIIARDTGCVWPGCNAPPAHCEVQHTTHWADGGNTSTHNAALLCWHHHQHVDTNHITMHYDNGWHFGPRGSYRLKQ